MHSYLERRSISSVVVPLSGDYCGMKTPCALARPMPVSSELHEDDAEMVREVDVANGVAVVGR